MTRQAPMSPEAKRILGKVMAARTSSSLAGASDDALIMRHVFSGLGVKSSAIGRACACLGVRHDALEHPLDAARDALDALSAGAFTPGPGRKFILDAGKAKNWTSCWNISSLPAYRSAALSLSCGLIVGCRIREKAGNDECAAFVFVREPGPEGFPEWLLRPVSTLVERSGGVCVWVRRMKDLVRDMADVLKWDAENALGDMGADSGARDA